MKKVEILENMANEIYAWNGCFEDIACIYYSISDLLENVDWTKEEVASAVFCGDIRNWYDDIFYIDSYGNFSSCSEKTFEREILNCKDEIIDEFLEIFGDSLKNYQREWLEELGVDLND